MNVSLKFVHSFRFFCSKQKWKSEITKVNVCKQKNCSVFREKLCKIHPVSCINFLISKVKILCSLLKIFYDILSLDYNKKKHPLISQSRLNFNELTKCEKAFNPLKNINKLVLQKYIQNVLFSLYNHCQIKQ